VGVGGTTREIGCGGKKFVENYTGSFSPPKGTDLLVR
jgi:hypothetical protein